jgi:hypothetical protein
MREPVARGDHWGWMADHSYPDQTERGFTEKIPREELVSAHFGFMERPVAQIVERVRPGYYSDHKLPNPLAGSASTALPVPIAAPCGFSLHGRTVR